jgi:hypothetical protein
LTDRRPALGLLRAFARKRPVPGAPPLERCELCGAAIGHERSTTHEHLLEPARRELRCVCPSCAFTTAGKAGSPWRRVPRAVERLASLRLGDEEWESLEIPVRMAFFVRGGDGHARAYYPSPAGATESRLALEAWQGLVTANPVLGRLEAETEALLVNRVGTAREHYRVPIDRCFGLVGLIRLHWRGFTGGADLAGRVARFFADLGREAGHA